MTRVVIDEIDVQATIERNLSRRRTRAVFVTLAHQSFLKRMRRAVRAAAAEFPELSPVRWRLRR